MRALAATLAVLVCASAAGAQPAANQLARVKGDVHYGTPPRALVGRIDVPDDTRVATAFRAAADVTFADSSVVQIGDNTDVAVGRGHVISLTRGALRFTIRHPGGGAANYVFVTPTSQVAVRGTLAYLVSGPAGDQIYCIDCAAGDVAVAAAGETYGVLSGQTLNVRRRANRAFDAVIVPNASINNPAIDQFLHGFSPFGRPTAEGSDFTQSGSGMLQP